MVSDKSNENEWTWTIGINLDTSQKHCWVKMQTKVYKIYKVYKHAKQNCLGSIKLYMKW